MDRFFTTAEGDPRNHTKNHETQSPFLSFMKPTNMLDCCTVVFETTTLLSRDSPLAITSRRHGAASGNPLDHQHGDRAKQHNVDEAAFVQDEFLYEPDERERDSNQPDHDDDYYSGAAKKMSAAYRLATRSAPFGKPTARKPLR